MRQTPAVTFIKRFLDASTCNIMMRKVTSPGPTIREGGSNAEQFAKAELSESLTRISILLAPGSTRSIESIESLTMVVRIHFLWNNSWNHWFRVSVFLKILKMTLLDSSLSKRVVTMTVCGERCWDDARFAFRNNQGRMNILHHKLF